jgi:hypothetical protein
MEISSWMGGGTSGKVHVWPGRVMRDAGKS